MVLEGAQLLKIPVTDQSGQKLGVVDTLVFVGEEARLHGFQVSSGGVISKFTGLHYDDVLAATPHSVVVSSPEALKKDLKSFDEIMKGTGPVVGVTARTESGKKLGKVTDILLDSESGFIVRFYLRYLLHERIIPRQYLVSITPKAVVFKDVVDTPLFNQVATADAAPAT